MARSTLLPPLQFTSPTPIFIPLSSLSRSFQFSLLSQNPHRKINGQHTRIRAIREWQEYEEAVKSKDLARALRFLRDVPVELESSSIESPRQVNGELRLLELERDWEVLDTCLNADDMLLVGSAYAFLRDRGLLPNFGKYRNIVLEGTRDVTPSVLKSSTGLEVSKLSPKKWGVSGSSSLLLIALLAGVSILLNQGIDIRPNLAAILGLTILDATFLGGSCLAQISSYWPPYRRRILVHEAGHLLVAYLMGCPIRGVILDPIVAVQMGIQGQVAKKLYCGKVSKLFSYIMSQLSNFDSIIGSCSLPQFVGIKDLVKKIYQNSIPSLLFIPLLGMFRYCMVLFAGIAAEALIYGEAEGGENDENLFRSFCILLQPPLSVAEMSNQARWSVLQAYNLLKWHRRGHRAAVKALESGGSLSIVIKRIEEAMSSKF